MTSFPSPPDPEPETNPYAAPLAEIGVSRAEPGDVLEADEAIRRAHLGHEAAVKLIGTLHYLGAACGVFFVLGFLGYVVNRGVGAGAGSIGFFEIAVLGLYAALTGLNIALGIGLRRLQTWARWTEVVLIAFGLAVTLLAI